MPTFANISMLIAICVILPESLSYKNFINSLIFQDLHPNTETQLNESQFINAIIKQSQYTSSSNLGTPIVSNLETSIISVDVEKPVNIDLPYENGDIATDIMELLYISKLGEVFSIKRYNIDYYYNPDHVIHSITSKKEAKNNEPIIQCSYSIGNNSFNHNTIALNDSYDKILRYSYITLGFSSVKGKVYRLILDSNTTISIKEISLYEDIDSSNSIYHYLK